jgi:hypothetical protein
MTTTKAATLAFVLAASAGVAAAQQPPRPAETPRTVTLSLTEYNRLIDLARRPPQGAAAAPVAAVLSSADLRVRVERDTARGVFNLAGDVLRAGINKVGLLSGATLVEANAAGRPLPLVAEGNAHTALLPGPGPFGLTLEWGAPLMFVPGRASFTLPVPQAGTARATIDLPGDLADVHLSAGLITRRSAANGRTMVEATLDPGSSTEVWWSMRDSAPAAAAREVRALGDVLTLMTLGDSDVRMVALIDVTVVQGQPRTIEARLPSGYEVTGIAGSTLESSDQRDGTLVLTLSEPAARRHQFLVSFERPHDGGTFKLDTGFLTLLNVQRERGEVAVEGVGTLELTAAEREGMHRIDVRELDRALRSLARLPLLSAYRYQRAGGMVPGLALEARRFADAGVLAAFADNASATTLVTTEGRALTEVRLIVQNRAQPFLKVTLPAGASIVSVDVAGQSAKPALGTDGTRVPLLRPGFRPKGPYEVSFVYLHAGTPFARKGDMQMALPKMDLPVGLVEWEVFVPDNYSIRTIDGNVLDRWTIERAVAVRRMGRSVSAIGGVEGGVAGGTVSGLAAVAPSGVYVSAARDALTGQIRGHVRDSSGAVLPGVTILLEAGRSNQTATTGGDGAFVLSGVPSGTVSISAQLRGFATERRSLEFDQQPQQVDFVLRVGSVAETVTVTGEVPRSPGTPRRMDEAQKVVEPSQNVLNLQQKAVGVLPVRVDVPHAGTSHQFVKALVTDQETTVTFRYKRR